ncbi:uncharacterized protein LOC118412148 [Branchiostoma floridae]|nr:uncharacterized protein LOC118412148 [Branchiostoma floridae]XP_035670744.1 uncharacterized protein LOC118412148 [Branchiostoma floridae]
MTGPLAFSLLVALSCSVLVNSATLPAYRPDLYHTAAGDPAVDWRQLWRELLQSGIVPDRTASTRHYDRRAPLGLPGKRAEPTMRPYEGDDDDLAMMERSNRRRVPLFGFPGKRMSSWNVLEKKAPFALPGKRGGEETQNVDLVPEAWVFPDKPTLSRRAPSLALPGKR